MSYVFFFVSPLTNVVYDCLNLGMVVVPGIFSSYLPPVYMYILNLWGILVTLEGGGGLVIF